MDNCFALTSLKLVPVKNNLFINNGVTGNVLFSLPCATVTTPFAMFLSGFGSDIRASTIELPEPEYVSFPIDRVIENSSFVLGVLLVTGFLVRATLIKIHYNKKRQVKQICGQLTGGIFPFFIQPAWNIGDK